MAQEEEEELEAPSAPFWLVTYGDMVTLLLTFFVMIVAMSEIKKDHFMEAMSYFSGRTSVFENAQPVPIIPRPSEESMEAIEQAQRVETLLEFIQEEGLEDKVQINFEEESMHVVITDAVMFNSGSSIVQETAREILSLVSSVSPDMTESITVIGHTDNQPISTSQYPSNWELSAARASSVVRFLLTQENSLPPERYQAIGQGEHDPVDTNDSPDGRARNRRIELLINWKQWQNKTQSSQPSRLLPTP